MKRLEHPQITAKNSWLALGAGVLAYELVCPSGELLSEGIDRAIDKYPKAVPFAIGYTALHLMNMLPKEVDAYHHIFRRLRHEL